MKNDDAINPVTPSNEPHTPEKQENEEVSFSYLRLKSPPAWLTSESLLGSTDTVIGGTISALDALNATVNQFETETVSRLLDAGLGDHLNKNLAPIKSELDTVKNQVSETRQSLSMLKEFLDNNATLLANLISAEGRMVGLESLVNSVSSRLDKLEQERNTNWNKNITVVSVIVAIIGACTGVVGLSWGIYTVFLNQ